MEQQAAVMPGFGTPGQGAGGVLSTKLFIPRPPHGFVSRPRLLSQLDHARSRGLGLVSAPAGFGKTALLADWCRRVTTPVVWLSLDPGDNDPARFWRHVAAGFAEVRPDVARRVAPMLGSPDPMSFDGLVAALVNLLAADPRDVLLVLDDYHVIEAGSVHDGVQLLLDHAPPGMDAVLACRADPPLPLARWRASGRLAEVRAADLRLTTEESVAMLREAVGPGQRLSEGAALAMVARTEGWAAGLQLVALSLRDSPDVTELVESFSGSHRYVSDYLAEEVLERQAAPVRDFLLESCVLDRLSGPVCDAITGRVDSQQMLESIERANLFLVPMDDTRGWWRYHHLFADALRARLEQERPERARELHRASAVWHERHKLVDDAIRHALAADEALWAARLIERYFDEFFLGREGATVQRWIDSLPSDVTDSRPRLHLARAALSIVAGWVGRIESALEAAERTRATAVEAFEPSVGRPASRLANVNAGIALGRGYTTHLRGDREATIEYASRALAELDENDWMLRGLAETQLAFADWMHGSVGAAERAFASNIARWRAVGQHDLAVYMSSYLGRIQAARGQLDAAWETYRQPLELNPEPSWLHQPVLGVSYVGMAELSYLRDELDTAMEHLTQALSLCRLFVYTQPLATGLATLSRVRQARGDAAGALEAMDEAVDATDPSVTDLFNPVPAQRAAVQLAQGDVSAAARWVHDRGLHPDDTPRYVNEPAYLVLARVLRAEGDSGRALTLLDRLGRAATADDRTGSVIEIQVLRARALAATGDERASVAALSEALTLAQPQSLIRVFVDEGPPMAALLDQLLTDDSLDQAEGAQVEYLRRLALAFERAVDLLPRETHPADELSDRELEVLRLLASGRTNQMIADELFVTLHTVKKHVTHILRKLRAGNRTEATARARELGLLGFVSRDRPDPR
jgi:LuxR family maltose regulon positive regulatory protein